MNTFHIIRTRRNTSAYSFFLGMRINRIFSHFLHAHKPTRGAKILDLILTNMHTFYDVQPAIVFPPYGLSDHNMIMVEPKVKTSSEIPSRKTVIKRDIHQSRKKEIGRCLSNFDWQLIDSSQPCDKNCDILYSAIKMGYDIFMPEKHVKFHRNDNPGITEN